MYSTILLEVSTVLNMSNICHMLLILLLRWFGFLVASPSDLSILPAMRILLSRFQPEDILNHKRGDCEWIFKEGLYCCNMYVLSILLSCPSPVCSPNFDLHALSLRSHYSRIVKQQEKQLVIDNCCCLLKIPILFRRTTRKHREVPRLGSVAVWWRGSPRCGATNPDRGWVPIRLT
jgi:hypothetical protein